MTFKIWPIQPCIYPLPCLVVDMEDSHVRELPNYCHFPH